MPHLQKLQEEFGKNIQIIIVTKNSKNEIDKLFKRIDGHVSKNIIYASKHLPFIVEDSLLSEFFHMREFLHMSGLIAQRF